jgi:hypothetical protein
MRKLVFLLLLAVTASSAPQSATPQGRKHATIEPEAPQIFELANQARAVAGVAQLTWDSALAMAARDRCMRITLEDATSHRYKGEADLQERAGLAGAHFSLVVENLAIDSDPAAIHKHWTDLVDNRGAMLNPDLDRVGIAVVAFRGMLYAVADYAHFVPVLTQVPVEDAISDLLRARGLIIAQDRSDARGLCAGRSIASVKPSFVMIWQNLDLTKLTDSLVQVLPQAHFCKAAVGNCPAQDLDGNFNQYRVAALFYSTGVGLY